MQIVTGKMLFPIGSNGRTTAIAKKIEGSLQQYRTALFQGYRTPVQRAGTQTDIDRMSAKIGLQFSQAGITYHTANITDALTRTLWLNPNVTLGNDTFIFHGQNEGHIVHYTVRRDPTGGHSGSDLKGIRVEQKRYLAESLIKAMIGEIPDLSRMDFQKVAGILNCPDLFADSLGYDPENILTPVPAHNGVVGDFQGNCWSPSYQERSLPGYSMIRGHLLEANQKYLKAMLSEFSLKHGRQTNIDLGCGQGNLITMLPAHLRPSFVHMDWNPEYLNYVARNYPGTNVKRGNIYDMPFADGSVDNCIGLTPFVSLLYLDRALEDIFRALKPGGVMFALQDIVPNDTQMAEQLIKRGLYPYADRTCYSAERITDDTFRDQISRDATGNFSLNDQSGWENYVRRFNEVMVIQNVYEYLQYWLLNEMKYAGFKVPYCGFEKVFNVVPRQIQHVMDTNGQPTERNVVFRQQSVQDGPFHRTFTLPGLTMGDVISEIGPDNLLQYSIFWGIVGKKP